MKVRNSDRDCFFFFRSNLSISALNNNINNRYSFRRKPILGKPVHDSRVSEVVRMHTRLECTLAHFASGSKQSDSGMSLKQDGPEVVGVRGIHRQSPVKSPDIKTSK